MRTLPSAHYQSAIQILYGKMLKAAFGKVSRQIFVTDEEARQISEHPHFVVQLEDPKRLRGWTDIEHESKKGQVVLDRREDGQYVIFGN